MTKKLLLLTFIISIAIAGISQNYALDFDGTEDYVNVTTFATLNDNFTIELWFKADSWSNASYPGLVSRRTSFANMDWELVYNGDNSRIEFVFGNYGANTAFDALNVNPSTNFWHHLVVTFNNTTDVFTLYLDGELKGTETISGATITSNFSLFIGSLDASTDYFNGAIDEVRIWSDVRTQDEIRGWMCGELTGSEDNLVAYYKLNETEGIIADNAQGTDTYDGNLNGTGFSFDNNSVAGSTSMITGSGTSGSPYQVSTANHLNYIKNNSAIWDKEFRQTSDIDATGTSTWNSGEGLIRIGKSSPYFTGTYDGGGYSISNLSNGSDITTNYSGLFGYGQYCTIKNLGLNNVSITVAGTLIIYVGGIVGKVDYGLISNCNVSGTITGNSTSNRFGGICGDAYSSTIQFCGSTADITSGSILGGLIGITGSSKIVNCFATGSVEATTQDAGGLIGKTATTDYVANSYSTGDIINSGSITNAGGFIGYNLMGSGRISNSFWDTETSNISQAVGYGTSTGVTGKTTTEMNTLSTFTSAGWDFTSPVWDIDGGTNNGYPNLESSTNPCCWLGSVNLTDWTRTQPWAMGTPPTSSEDVSITGNSAYYPTIGDNVECNNLVINSGSSNAELTVDNDGSLTINGNLTNNGTFTLNSTALGTGSLIVEGNISGSGTNNINRYIPSWSTGDGWHFLSSPVSSQNISTEFVDISGTISTNLDFYRWSEPLDTWINIRNGSNTYNQGIGESYFSSDADPTFTVGQGYLVAYSTNQTKTFSGTLNNADISKSGLTYTEGSTHYGANFLGNPYPCALQWDLTSASWSRSNVDGTAKIWNSTNASYTDVAQGGIIPAMQGFMVLVNNAAGGSLNINAGDRTHSSTSWYKNDEINKIKLTAFDPLGKTAQESILKVKADATNDFDHEYDSPYFEGYAPKFYSMINSMPVSTNTFSEFDENMVIPFVFVRNQSSDFYIEVEGIENLNPARDVYLFDHKNNFSHNLTQNPVYHFTSEEGDDPNRFILHFSPLDIDELDITNQINVFAANGNVEIRNTVPFDAEVNIYNISGQLISSTRLLNKNSASIKIPDYKGPAVVSVITDNNVINRKVIIW